MIYFIADTHFDHSNIIKSCERPYDSVEDMKEDYINKWNSKVTPTDTIVIVGDLTLSQEPKVVNKLLSTLNGRKIIIAGNHDKYLSKEKFDKSFVRLVDNYYEIEFEGKLFVISHYPMTSWNKSHHGSYHIHGHSHNKEEYNNFNIQNGIRKYDVGVDANNGEPISIQEIIGKFGEIYHQNNIGIELPRHTLYKELMIDRPEYFSDLEYIEIEKDFNIIKQYEINNNVHIGIKHKSNFNIFVVDLVKNVNGDYFPYERIIPAKEGGVVCIPVYKDNVVFQYVNRHATRTTELELPRGYGEGDISSLNAIKELNEELNAKVDYTDDVCYVYADTGLTATKVNVVMCLLEDYSDNVGHEGLIKSKLYPLENIKNGMLPLDLRCGLSIAALSKFVDKYKSIYKNPELNHLS